MLFFDLEFHKLVDINVALVVVTELQQHVLWDFKIFLNGKKFVEHDKSTVTVMCMQTSSLMLVKTM